MRKAFILLSVLVILAACTTKTDGPKTSTGAFIGGTDGLAVTFSDGAPPEEIFDENYSFNINVMLQNVGEWAVPKDKVYISILGINPADFDVTQDILTNQHPADDLDPVQRDPQGTKIPGTITNVEFQNLQYTGKVSGAVNFQVVARACYGYGTNVQTKICLNQDLIKRNGEKGTCDPNLERQVENSGAPVEVSSMDESVLGSSKVALTFTLKHVGTGTDIYTRDTVCQTGYQTKDRIHILIKNPNIGTLQCSRFSPNADGDLEGDVQLVNGETTVRCTLDATGQLGDFEKVLNIQLMYDVKNLVTTEIAVKHGA